MKRLKRFFARRPAPAERKLGVLAVMKNEAMNLREWVDHYRWQGVDKIFLVNNGSTDGALALIEKEVADGFIELLVRPERHRQWAHYQAAFSEAGIPRQVEWLVMADLDEFWFAPATDLHSALDEMTDVDLIYANWKIFGSSGYRQHPPSLRRCLTLRHADLGLHSDTKWICRTAAIVDSRDISLHKVSGIDSARVVSDNVRFHLNHYPIQSVEYFTKVKMTRGDASSPDRDAVRTMEYFVRYDAPATTEDRVLADLLSVGENGQASE